MRLFFSPSPRRISVVLGSLFLIFLSVNRANSWFFNGCSIPTTSTMFLLCSSYFCRILLGVGFWRRVKFTGGIIMCMGVFGNAICSCFSVLGDTHIMSDTVRTKTWSRMFIRA